MAAKIHFYATPRHLWTMRRFITSWAPHLTEIVRPTTYDQIEIGRPLDPGVHIFADLERLMAPELALVRRLHAGLRAQPQSYTVLNDARTWLGRLELLGVLADEGINDFRAHRVGDHADIGFPAFLRWENDHSGSLGGPVDSVAALARRHAAVSWRRRLVQRRRLMVTEQLDVRDDDGLYRKYSAMMIGDLLVPRHVLFSRSWITKEADVNTRATAAEESAYLENLPHQDLLRRVFELSGVTYGRIDYGFHRGRLQVWEINTNPVVVHRRSRINPKRRPSQSTSAAAVTAALESLAAGAPRNPGAHALGLTDRVWWRGQARLSRTYDRFRH